MKHSENWHKNSCMWRPQGVEVQQFKAMFHSVPLFSFCWCCNPFWVLACSTVFFHVSVSLATLLQSWILINTRSSVTSPSQLNLGLPISTAVSPPSPILFAVFSSSNFTICPIRLILCNSYLSTTSPCLGTTVAQWLRRCATNQMVAVSIPAGVIGIFHWHNPSDRTMALVSTQPLTEMAPGVFPGGKKRPVLKADNLITILSHCHVIWEP